MQKSVKGDNSAKYSQNFMKSHLNIGHCVSNIMILAQAVL